MNEDFMDDMEDIHDDTSHIGGNEVRPTSLSEYIGQEKLKKKVSVAINASKKRHKPIDHMLFYGPPGLGKTTISNLISISRGVGFKSLAAPSIEKAGDLVGILLLLAENDILFIDEIHRLPHHVEEVLYSAMEDFFITIAGNMENGGDPVRITLPKFTLVGATTRPGMLSLPLKDRFGIQAKLEYYSPDELALIIKKASQKVGFNITDTACRVIANRGRGTPRVALMLMNRLYDYYLSENCSLDDIDTINDVLNEMSNIDESGLSDSEVTYMTLLNNHGRLGLKSISSMMSEDQRHIEDFIEPYLMQNEFVMITNRGRQLTDKGLEYLDTKVG